MNRPTLTLLSHPTAVHVPMATGGGIQDVLNTQIIPILFVVAGISALIAFLAGNRGKALGVLVGSMIVMGFLALALNYQSIGNTFAGWVKGITGS